MARCLKHQLHYIFIAKTFLHQQHHRSAEHVFDGLVVMISACHCEITSAGDRGSIPRRRVILFVDGWTSFSLAGWQAGGPRLNQITKGEPAM
jgi:hypothetical protein